MRLAVWNADLSRDGPGLLLRDLRQNPPVEILDEIARVSPDVLLLTRFDWDFEGRALDVFRKDLTLRGLTYLQAYAPVQNRGPPQKSGRFTGDGAMVLLSKFPLGALQDYGALPWRNGLPLAASGFWIVPIHLSQHQTVHLLAWSATPALGGELSERNRDETAFWLRWLEGEFGPIPNGAFIMAAHPNRAEGQGDETPFLALTAHPKLGPALHEVSSQLPSGKAALSALIAGPEWRVDEVGTGAADTPSERVFHYILWADLTLLATP